MIPLHVRNNSGYDSDDDSDDSDDDSMYTYLSSKGKTDETSCIDVTDHTPQDYVKIKKAPLMKRTLKR